MVKYKLLSLDVETTGLHPLSNQILQIGCVPLDSHFVPELDLGFNEFIQPVPEYNVYNVEKYNFAFKNGRWRNTVVESFRSWADSLLGDTYQKFIPLGHNYYFDRPFLVNFLGLDMYEQYFFHRYKDTQVVASYLNDLALMRGETIPFISTGLEELCSQLDIRVPEFHDAFNDSVATGMLYGKLIDFGDINYI